jgi:hypothetical protein
MKMTFLEFNESIKLNNPPPELNHLLQALWYDAKGNWETAHNLAQEVNTKDGAWIHAYLHRKEGDPGNASYWYHQAGLPLCKKSLAEEWQDIAQSLLRSLPVS